MINGILIVLLILICIFAVKGSAKRMIYGCCGGRDVEKKKKVADRDPSHYPYCAQIRVEVQEMLRAVDERSVERHDGGVFPQTVDVPGAVWRQGKNEYAMVPGRGKGAHFPVIVDSLENDVI